MKNQAKDQMNKVKTNLSGTTVEAFLNKAEKYLGSLEKQVFQHIIPAVNEVKPKVQRMAELQEEVIEGSHKAVKLRNELRKELTRDLSRMCDWINIHANGDRSILDMCAFEPHKVRSTSPKPSGIRKLAVYRAAESGKAQIVWKGNGAKFYRTQMTTDPTSNESWRDVATVTSNRCELTGLPIGTYCFFRVQGVNASGAGDYSEVYMYMAS